MSEEMQAEVKSSWFHEENGERKGPITEAEIINLIKASKISHGVAVWKKGFSDWVKVEETELRVHLDDQTPPPLTGDNVNNNVVWVLAFAPIIGLMLEYFIAGMFYKSEYQATAAVEANKLFYITLALNIGLSYLDEKRLKLAGHNTDRIKGWCWLVPVYLFQRAKLMKHNYAYFAVWIVAFVVSLSN